jgi:hypothetical protein
MSAKSETISPIGLVHSAAFPLRILQVYRWHSHLATACDSPWPSCLVCTLISYDTVVFTPRSKPINESKRSGVTQNCPFV